RKGLPRLRRLLPARPRRLLPACRGSRTACSGWRTDMSDDPKLPPGHRPPPNLRLGLKDKPEVKALLDELSKDLKPGEDPLFYELPDAPDDPSACAPNEARVYVGPTALPVTRHPTLEMDRVRVSPAVDPRRAATELVTVRPRAAAPDPGREDAP